MYRETFGSSFMCGLYNMDALQQDFRELSKENGLQPDSYCWVKFLICVSPTISKSRCDIKKLHLVWVAARDGISLLLTILNRSTTVRASEWLRRYIFRSLFSTQGKIMLWCGRASDIIPISGIMFGWRRRRHTRRSRCHAYSTALWWIKL